MEQNKNCMAVSCLSNEIDQRGELIKENKCKTEKIKIWKDTQFFLIILVNRKILFFRQQCTERNL